MTEREASSWQSDSKLKWASYGPTLLLCVALVLIAGQSYQGIFLALLLPVWAIWGIALACLKRHIILSRIKIVIWIVTLAILFCLHWMYSTQVRKTADHYVQIIEQYKRARGIYPTDLKAAGLNDLGRRVLVYHASVGNDVPMLYYRDTVDPFEKWFYDFDSRTWELVGD